MIASESTCFSPFDINIDASEDTYTVTELRINVNWPQKRTGSTSRGAGLLRLLYHCSNQSKLGLDHMECKMIVSGFCSLRVPSWMTRGQALEISVKLGT